MLKKVGFRWRAVIWFLTLMVTFTTLMTGQALADNAGLTENDSQPIIELKKNPAELKLESEYKKDANAVKKALTEGTREDYLKALKEFGMKWKGSSDVPLTQPGNISVLTVWSKVLGVQARGQETTYYCGPASAVQLLLYKGITRNPKDSRPTTQTNLANDLRTTTSGTGFPGYWSSTMQNWTNHSYWCDQYPSSDDLWLATCIDVDLNWPLIYDTHMNSTNGYLPGYSSGDIYHYVTGDGYYNNDSHNTQIHYVDPNRYRSAAFGAHWTSLNQMWKVVRDRGIVW